ncbi:MAG: helix-turn-helix transcriptional regulator [Clostridia bacterium]|nr:helix-turn-helix transcriptional regulator [Clostridia bacterium]
MDTAFVQRKKTYEIKRKMVLESLGVAATVYMDRNEKISDENENAFKSSDDFSSIHTHPTFEIFFSSEDRDEIYTENGKVDFGKRVAVIPPNVQHFYKENKKRPIMAFLFELTPADKRNTAVFDSLYRYLSKEPRVIDFAGTPIDLYGFSALSDSDSPADIEQTQFIAFALLAFVLNKVYSIADDENKQKLLPPRNIVLIEGAARDLLKEGRLSLKNLSKSIFLSEKQIGRTISKTYGMNFTRYANEIKLAMARALLKNTDLPISTVAERSYFASEKYFYSLFKSTYGMTPNEYRSSFSK